MKNKIICFILCILCLPINISVSAAADYKSEKSYLQQLFSEGAEDIPLTRGKAADYLMGFMQGYDFKLEKNTFKDVPKSHEYHTDITTITSMKIMTGYTDGKFRPENNVTEEEFITWVMRMGGYESYIQAIDKPGTYITLARRNGISIGKNLKAEISEARALEILRDALDMPYCRMNAINSGGNAAYSMDSDYTLLNHYFKMVKKRAIVTAVGEMHIKGYTAGGLGTVSIFDGSSNLIYDTLETDLSEYLGAEAYCYVTEDYARGGLAWIEPLHEQNKVTIRSLDIAEVARDRTYITYDDGGKKTQKAKIAIDAAFIYNGMNYDLIEPDEMKKDFVRVTLIDVNDDNVYDVVDVREDVHITVGYWDSVGKKIRDKVTQKTYDFNPDSYDNGIEFFYEGKKSEFQRIGENDLLSVQTSKDNSMCRVYISKNVIEGKITMLASSKNLIAIDGEEYETAFDVSSAGPDLNSFYRFGIDRYGEIVTFEKRENDSKYIYALQMDKKDVLDDTVRFRFVDESGNIVVEELAEKFYVDGARSDYDSFMSALGGVGGEIQHQLLRVQYFDGKIKRIETAPVCAGFAYTDEYRDFEMNYEAEAGVDNFYNANIGNKMYAVHTQTFYIAMDDYGNICEEEILAGKYENIGLKSNIKPKFKVYDMGLNRIPKAMVVYGKTGKTDQYLSTGRLSSRNAFLIENKFTALNDEGVEITGLRGMLLAMPMTFYGIEGEAFDDLDEGDVINPSWYRGNELRTYTKLFTLNSKKGDPSTLLAEDKEYTNLSTGVNSTAVNNWSITGVYGKIEEIGRWQSSNSRADQNSNASRYSVVVRPKGEPENGKMLTYTFNSQRNTDASGSFIYIFSKRTNKATFVEFVDINLVGKDAFVFSYNGTAKAIVIYE